MSFIVREFVSSRVRAETTRRIHSILSCFHLPASSSIERKQHSRRREGRTGEAIFGLAADMKSREHKMNRTKR